jgi:predicted dehydrogenase
MQKSVIRWGVLGAARINERMLPAMSDAHNAKLVAIASRRRDAAAEAAARFPGVRAVASYEELLETEDIDAVYIPLLNHLHSEWVVRAAAARKHILCEKPLALNLAQMEAIEQAASEHNVRVMEGFMYRFHPQHQRVREILASGIIGPVRLVNTSYSFLMSDARQHRASLSVERGGGAMWDVGCYAISTARMIFQEEPRSAEALAHFATTGADLTTTGTLDFGNGRYATFDASFECARRSQYEVTGEHGSVRCERVWQLPGDVPVVHWWTDDGRGASERLPWANHFQLEIEGFSEALLKGEAPRLGLDDARGNLRAILACLDSAAASHKGR